MDDSISYGVRISAIPAAMCITNHMFLEAPSAVVNTRNEELLFMACNNVETAVVNIYGKIVFSNWKLLHPMMTKHWQTKTCEWYWVDENDRKVMLVVLAPTHK